MWLMFLKDHWKTFSVLVAMLACFGGGAYLGRKSTKPQIEIQVQEKIVEKEKIVTVEVEKKHQTANSTTTIVANPDGSSTTTIVEHTETTSETSTESQQESEIVAETKTQVKPTPAAREDKYRLGMFVARPIPELLRDPLYKPNWGVTAGTRVFGPAWIDTSYNFSNKEVSLGLSIQI
jgi:hypothetical protein